MAKCASCNSRKGKRNCPGLVSAICSQCCGIKREKEIDCPEDCFYLGKSKQYFTDRQEARKISDFERELKSVEGNEDDYLDILQNMEFAIHRIYKEHGNINDRHVETALEYFIEMGKAQSDVPAKFLTELPPNIQAIVDAVDDILSFRDSLTGEKEGMMTKLKCIYRILDSVKTHFNSGDDCSYLNFVGQFLK
ncbi:hypothetical protein QUF80_12500 [Desulfococcaceae bacterium HSG8]|nr:hypothetical protein [Desulfococcaceae bacterium HSG8]